MEPFTPFAGPYANGLPPWHHSGHLDRSFNDDSGYASEDSDSVPFLPLDSDNDHQFTNQANPGSPRMQRHRAAALVSTQRSHPVAYRTCRPFHDSFNDSSKIYDLPQPLPLEQQPDNYVSGSRLKPTSYTSDIFDRESGHTFSQWDLEEVISPLDVEEHRARIPDTLPSLSNRIESETDHCPLSPNSLGHELPSPEVKLEGPQPLRLITSAQPDNDRNGNTMPSSSARPRCQHQSSNPNTQLAAAWQQLYQERTELEKDRRALRKKKKENFILQQLKEGPCSSRRDLSDEINDYGRSGNPDRSGQHGEK